MTKLTILVFASDKVRPAFELLESMGSVKIYFTDWSISLQKLVYNVVFMLKADVVYLHSPTSLRIIMIPLARLLRRPVLLQWIGTDVLLITFKKGSTFYDIGTNEQILLKDALLSPLPVFSRAVIRFVLLNSRIYLLFLKRFVTRHVACAPHLVRNLQCVGINASYLKVLCHIQPEPLPLPDNFAVLTYVGYHPQNDESAFYGWSTIIRLARDYPELTIFVVGRKHDIDEHLENIIFLGYVKDIRLALKKVKAVIRLTYHDGMPRLILEGLATGRFIIYTQPFPHSFYVKHYEDVKVALEKIRKTSTLNIGGLNYVQNEFNPYAVASNFLKEFQLTKE